MIVRLLILILLCLLSSDVSAAPAPVSFHRLSSSDGLPQNTARALLQDSTGFIWIGTEDGLVRFDGYDVRPFRKQHNNPASLSDNYVSALAEDPAGRIWAGTMGGGLNLILPGSLQVIRIQELSSADVFAITANPHGEEIWLGTDSGLHRLRITTHDGREPSVVLEKMNVTLPDGSVLSSPVTGVVLTGDELWLSTRGKGLGRYRRSDENTRWYLPGDAGLADDTFNMMMQDQQGNLWAGGQNKGLVQVLRGAEMVSFRHYDTVNSALASNDVMAIADGAAGRLWVGTWNGGLALFDLSTEKMEIYRNQREDPRSLASDIIMEIIRGSDGKIWVGTFDGGVTWFDPDPPFRTYRAKPEEPGGLPGNLIWAFASEGERGLWVASNRGISRLDLESHDYGLPEGIFPAALWKKVQKDDVRTLLMDGDQLWIAARHNGLLRLSLSTGELLPFSDLLEEGQELTHPYVRLLLKDSRGILWIGSTSGLNRFDPIGGSLRNYMPDDKAEPSLPHRRIRALFEDSRGDIWVGTSQGLLLINGAGDPVKVWHPGPFDPAAELILAGEGIRGLGEDSRGRIWMATEGGITLFDPVSGEAVILREEDGLPSNATYCALPVEQYMWVSTLRGLARVDSATLEVERYYSSDGLPDNEFNFNAWHRLRDGRLAFGGLAGFTLFSPLAVPGPEQKRPAPPLQLQTSVSDGESGLQTVVQEGGPLELSWQNNFISFSYSVLHYGTRDAVRYETFLQGVDNVWKKSGGLRMASYSGLAPGRYSFQVRAKDRHGRWQAESSPVSFTVSAPPWRTVQAYLLYVMLLLSLMFTGFFLYNRSLRRRAELLEGLVAERTAELEASSVNLAEKNRQLDHLMTTRERLFRALSHEIRTPLSVIISVLELVQKHGVEALEKVPMARQSSLRLDRLLDNILDLSRRELQNRRKKGSFPLQPALDEVFAPYVLQAETEGKKLQLEGSGEGLWLDLSREVFMMLVSNLLSNACKYTGKGDSIRVAVESANGFFQLIVDDSGCGVPQGEEETIFDWFSRGGAGSSIDGWGIGLAFVREEAEAAGGQVQLDDTKRDGARFVLSLPLGEAGGTEQLLEGGSNSIERFQGREFFVESEKQYTILLVEDDPDLLELLPGLFPAHWNCLCCSTAEQGFRLALEKLPDLVLTDLMLPGESGFDLTRRLKEDHRSSHIPVMILTALGNEERRLTGLGLSADSFMDKPFSNRELLLRVQGLIANRERVAAQVKRLIIGTVTGELEEELPENTDEDEFLQKLHAAFTTETELSAADLADVADRLAMSKRSVQREMQRLGISWREYKRLRKLRLAMDLLRDPGNRVATVAELAGYGSAAHFSKIFKRYTGISPTEWRRRQED